MVEAVWGRLLPISRQDRRDPGRWSRWLLRVVAVLRWVVVFAALFLLGWGLATEARTSYLQSRLLSRWAAEMKFSVQPGPSEEIRFPRSGPYDERRGYVQLPSFIEALGARHFAVTRQARWSPPLERFVDQGGYAIYGEKTRAGLRLYDRDRNPLYQASYPQRAYEDFASIPPLVVDSLLFIEDRYLLDLQDPRAQSGGRMGPLHACRGRAHRQRRRSPLPGGRRQHARHPDREIPPFAGRPYSRHRREVPSDADGVGARLSRRPRHDDARQRDRRRLSQFDPARLAARLRRGHRRPRGAVDLVRDRSGGGRPGSRRTPATTKAQMARKGEVYRQSPELCCSPAAGPPIT